MLSRIGFIAGLRCLERRCCFRDHRRPTRRRLVTTPPSPCPPGLGPPRPLPPSPAPTQAPTHHITLPSLPRRPPCWPSLTHTLKRYLVARFRGQVSPLLSEASDRHIKRSSVVRGVVGS